MKICVVGAGSIGGLMGVRLHNAGEDVTLIARGPHLQAIVERGLELQMNDGTVEIARGVKATADMSTVPVQDLVIIGLKAHQIEPVIDEIKPMIGPDTIVMTTQNGIPWWYFQNHGGDYENTVVKTVDPNGTLARSINPDNILGCIAYPAAEISKPGVIKHIEGIRFPVGELDGEDSPRANEVVAMFKNAGFKSYVMDDIRSEIWLKLWGNLSFNPISALTHATLVDICQFDASRKLAEKMMLEAQEIAEHLGCKFRVSLEKRIAGAEGVGKHKTSMLQDVEAGKALEIDALVSAVVEFGEITNIPTPSISTVLALVELLNHNCQTEQLCVQSSPWETAPVSTPAPVTHVAAATG